MTLLESQNISLFQAFKELPPDGILYIKLVALCGGVIFYGGHYASDIEEGRERRIKIAAVICTYKREKFVYRNIQYVNQNLYVIRDSLICDNVDFLIIDNGHTIAKEKVENEKIKVFLNKNYGGSGGFTRGIIEAYRRKDTYTHVLLMDDDILFDTKILEKTVKFLQIIKPEYSNYSIAAGMLEAEKPFMQYAAGGIWKGRTGKLLKRNLDFRRPKSILINEREEEADYSGWWYQCIPLVTVEKHGLPFPFFIKADDEEYGIRTGKSFIFLSGIGIWHDSFKSKYNVYLEYYIKRNELVLNAIHYPQYGLLKNLFKLFTGLAKQVLLLNYTGLNYIMMAYEDFLKGVDFFIQTDEENLNNKLVQQMTVRPSNSFFSLLSNAFRLTIMMWREYDKVVDAYREKQNQITSFDFWCQHLNIKPVCKDEKRML
ncbi:hypothetical protein A7X67_18610 [Clostridium sp. W14A]|nr:hypothetical protein A7X67_18610 [Clostridium sp. W14A]